MVDVYTSMACCRTYLEKSFLKKGETPICTVFELSTKYKEAWRLLQVHMIILRRSACKGT